MSKYNYNDNNNNNGAGGDWNIVYNIIEEEFKDYNIKIFKLKEEK